MYKLPLPIDTIKIHMVLCVQQFVVVVVFFYISFCFISFVVHLFCSQSLLSHCWFHFDSIHFFLLLFPLHLPCTFSMCRCARNIHVQDETLKMTKCFVSGFFLYYSSFNSIYIHLMASFSVFVSFSV